MPEDIAKIDCVVEHAKKRQSLESEYRHSPLQLGGVQVDGKLYSARIDKDVETVRHSEKQSFEQQMNDVYGDQIVGTNTRRPTDANAIWEGTKIS